MVLDNSVLTVAIPTILRDFHTTLPTLEWVITGYALTFATLLIIGGRLGDVYGHRRIFVIGAALFGVRFAARGAVVERPEPDRRRGDHRGHRRLADAADHAGDHLDHLPGPRARHGVRGVGRDRRAWASRCGPVVGGFLTTELLVALGVPAST